MPGAPSCPTPPPWCTWRGGSGSRLGTAAVTMNVCQATAADVRNLPTAAAGRSEPVGGPRATSGVGWRATQLDGDVSPAKAPWPLSPLKHLTRLDRSSGAGLKPAHPVDHVAEPTHLSGPASLATWGGRWI